jgi:hypothetical protein
MLVEYMLHPEGYHGNKVMPNFIAEGSFWFDPDTFTYLGWVLPLAERGYYVPDSIGIFNLETATSRALAIHAIYPFSEKDSMGNDIVMSEDLLRTRIQEWYSYLIFKYQQVPINIESNYDTVSKTLRIGIIYKRVGLIVKGQPTLDILVNGETTTLTFERATPSSIVFSAMIDFSHGDTVVIPRISNISLNGGSITNGDPESVTLQDGRVYTPDNNITTSLDNLPSDKSFTIVIPHE